MSLPDTGGLERKNTFSLAIVGHVDTGKSTILGHLLYKLGFVSAAALHKLKKESAMRGKDSFAYAYVLDESESERARGITVDVALASLTTAKSSITVFDAPGHKEYCINAIGALLLADVAAVVVSAAPGEMDGGLRGGSTVEHLVLCKTLGIQRILLLVNKLDVARSAGGQSEYAAIDDFGGVAEGVWLQSEYCRVLGTMLPILKKLGFPLSTVHALPLVGVTGSNLTSPAGDAAPWWRPGPPAAAVVEALGAEFAGVAYREAGKTLVECLDHYGADEGVASSGSRAPTDQLRLLVDNVIPSLRAVVGRVESGVLKNKATLSFAPSTGLSAVVKRMAHPSATSADGSSVAYPVEEAHAGDLVECVLDISQEEMESSVRQGSVGYLKGVSGAVYVATVLRCLLLAFNVEYVGGGWCVTPGNAGSSKVFLGNQVTALVGLSTVPALIRKVHCSFQHVKNSQGAVELNVAGKSLTALSVRQYGIVEVILQSPCPVTTSNLCKSLSRVVLRCDGVSIAGGVIKEALNESYVRLGTVVPS